MGGGVGTFASLVQRDRASSADRYDNVSGNDIIGCMPTLFDLIKCYSSFVKGKACGEGLLVSDVFKSFPVHLSRIFYPLVVKTFVRIYPPPPYNGKVV